jgi:ATP-dependent Lon protease
MGLGNKDGVGVVEVQCTHLSPGKGELLITGNVSELTRMCVRTALALVEDQADAIIARLGVGTEPAGAPLMRRRTDLHVHIEHGFKPLESSYHMGAVVMSLVSLLIGKRADERVMVFGTVGNAGTVYYRGTISEEVVTNSGIGDCRRLIIGLGTEVAKAAEQQAAAPHADGRRKLELPVYDNMMDAVEAYFSPLGLRERAGV